MSLSRIAELSNLEYVGSAQDMQDNLEVINEIVKAMLIEKPESELNVIELTDLELEIVQACIEVVDDLPIGFEAIDGYVQLDEEGWEAIQSVKLKI